MTLKMRLKEAQAELKGLQAGVKAAEPEAIERAKKLVDEIIPELERAIERAKEQSALLAEIDAVNEVIDEEESILVDEAKSMTTIGEKAAAGIKSRGITPGSRFAIKAATDVQVTPESIEPALTTYDTRLVETRRQRLTVADLLGTENISGNALTYFVEGALEGGFGVVAENGQKPQIHFSDPEAVTEKLVKIAAFYKESDEILEDAAWLASSLNNRAVYQLGLYEEAELLNGTGANGGLVGLLNRNGVGVIQSSTETLADDIFKSIGQVQEATGMEPDAVIINPADWQTLRLSKDANNQYYGGSFFGYDYSGAVRATETVWGLRVVVTAAIAQGTFLVGAFRQGASIVRKGGVDVEMTNSNDNDFTNNRVTIRIEERLALAVRYPGAFVKGIISGE